LNDRYALRDRVILRWTMKHPGRGTPYSIRELAKTVGLSHHALIGHLLTGEREDCDKDTAQRIAEAVGVKVLVLFEPSTSPKPNGTAPEQQHRTDREPQPSRKGVTT
jgi:hypothetical protein